ncbi:MAG: molybdopterin-dependent oxidoreductase [Bryobacteraceae bacterium]|nr:molybdopterin-dependent oxidoreductase [Bryobacterales bacterium]MEB2362407.1 molybdopterin-dependent oxidoreductase [Bryobacterales bacterium]NUN01816.1 molybdopterin-dependent oxidoreductase [Bryobacteraceae bacterium]
MPEVRHSVCALDCPDCCSVLVTVENGRATRLRGNPGHPVTRGFLCGKVARYLDREYSPDRLLYPLRRTGAKGKGRFERISWDEALISITEELRSISDRFGPEAILPYSYAGTMGYLNGSGMDRRFFHRLGASRLDRTICSAAGSAGLAQTLGIRCGTEPEQFRESKLIIAWGANIHGTNVHLWPFIVEARRKGARLYVIDPIRTRTAELADRHFTIYPGSDLALAFGMAHVIIAENLCDRDYVERYTSGFESLSRRASEYAPERAASLTGLAAEDIRQFAREYATTRPAAIRLNYGMQRSERGGAAVRAIATLPALTGSWRDPGGGLQLTTSGAFQVDRDALEMPGLQAASPLAREARAVNMARLGEALTVLDNPPVKGLVVYNSNPAAIAPNQSLVLRGLQREDLFTVVLEQFQTDTADYADIVLPVTTFLEHTDLYFAYGHYYLQLARPALEPPGETKSNFEIFRLLAERLGFEEQAFHETEDDVIRAVLSGSKGAVRGITLEQLEAEHFVRLRFAGNGDAFLPFANGGFGSQDGKCNLSMENLDYVPPEESRLGEESIRRRYPLELVSSKNDDSMNSTFGHRGFVDEQTSVLWMHPADASERGIEPGEQVRVFNGRGSCLLKARITDGVRTGVVRAPSVRWVKRSPGGKGINVLTSDRLTDIGGGPVFYSCLVQVERCGD